ncbi:MAG TPA: TlpA disulfide reductase family protein [Actinomycetota bacterium]|nr:TlpA disulfide reductase family protein [Actinomycetota bacterium]
MAERTTKRERREAAKLARLEEQRRGRRRRAIRTWGIPLAVVAVIGAVAFLTTRGGGDPAPVGEVEASGPPRSTPFEAGETFPAFSAPELGGGRASWSPGPPSLIAIWAPWCPSCRAEMPVIDRLAEEFPGIEMVTVATAADDRPGPSITEFVEDGGISLPVALDDDEGTLARAMGIRGFPTLYLVDAEGVVLAAAEGQVEEGALREALREMLRAS